MVTAWGSTRGQDRMILTEWRAHSRSERCGAAELAWPAVVSLAAPTAANAAFARRCVTRSSQGAASTREGTRGTGLATLAAVRRAREGRRGARALAAIEGCAAHLQLTSEQLRVLKASTVECCNDREIGRRSPSIDGDRLTSSADRSPLKRQSFPSQACRSWCTVPGQALPIYLAARVLQINNLWGVQRVSYGC